MANETMTSGFIFANKNIVSNRVSAIDFHKITKKSMSSNSTCLYKKSKQSFSNNIQNLKLDINSLENCIKENTDILIYYKNPKLINLNKKFVEKIEEIEFSLKNELDLSPSKEININSIMKEYSCQNINDLLIKVRSLNELHEIFLKKLVNYVFLLNLKFNNENWRFEENYEESYSKFLWLKILIDNFIHRNKFSEEKSKFDNIPFNETVYEIENFHFEFKSCPQIYFLEQRSFSELNNSSLNFADSNVEGINEYLKKNKIQDKINKRRSSEDLPFVQISVQGGGQVWSNKELPKVFTRRNTEMTLPEDKKQVNDNESIVKMKDEEIRLLKKMFDDLSKKLDQMNGFDGLLRDKLMEENKELVKKNNELRSILETTKIELDNVKYSFEALSKKIKKGKDEFADYEEILKDNFEEMRRSFLKKYDDLSKEFTTFKLENNQKLLHLECEFKKSNLLNDVFLKQLR